MDPRYLLIWAWATVMVVVFPFVAVKTPSDGIGTRRKHSVLAVALLLLPLAAFAATRGWVANTDTVTYRYNFINVVPSTLSELPNYVSSLTKDRIFYVLTALAKIFVSKNPDVYFGIIATFQAIALVFLFRNFSEEPALSFFLFVVSTDYFSWMFNGMRQFVAACVVLFATPFLLRKKPIPALILILLASLLHASALIMIPIALAAVGKAWNKRTIFLLTATIVLAVFAFTSKGRLVEFLRTTTQGTRFGGMVDEWTSSGFDDGTNPIRAVVYSIPAIIAFVGRKKIIEEDDPIANLATNMSTISAGLYVLSVTTSGIFVGRLPIYCSLYGYVLLPWEANRLFDELGRRIFLTCMVIGYCAFHYYQMRLTWGVF